MVNAAVYDQRVYYGYPVASEAAQAEADLTNLRAQLGDRYPPALASVMLARAVRLVELGQAEKARKELSSLVNELSGADRDRARVEIGVADYERKKVAEAQSYLESLELDAGDADAQRLHYLLLCARRRDDRAAMNAIVERLAQNYPTSRWRMEALWALANLNLVDNQSVNYEPLYRACYESFPNDPRAAECHWKVAWAHYMRRADDAADYLRAHLTKFPGSDNAPASLYFLARLSESSGDTASARTYYNEIVREYPNHYYTPLARERLASGNRDAAPPLPAFRFPPQNRTSNPDVKSGRRISAYDRFSLAHARPRFSSQCRRESAR